MIACCILILIQESLDKVLIGFSFISDNPFILHNILYLLTLKKELF